MSWVSTQLYYREINKAVAAALGGSHSAKILLYSFDFAELELFQEREMWDVTARALGDQARKLAYAGAEVLAIASNTMHIVAGEVARTAGIPLLHIADATADALQAANVTKAGLLGTRYTMEKPFLRERLEALGIEVLVPDQNDRNQLHDIIFSELIRDVASESSRKKCDGIVERLKQRGAQGVVLGCTELELLVTSDATSVAIFETALLHARAIARYALEEKS